jgi:hypothetical protein
MMSKIMFNGTLLGLATILTALGLTDTQIDDLCIFGSTL